MHSRIPKKFWSTLAFGQTLLRMLVSQTLLASGLRNPLNFRSTPRRPLMVERPLRVGRSRNSARYSYGGARCFEPRFLKSAKPRSNGPVIGRSTKVRQANFIRTGCAGQIRIDLALQEIAAGVSPGAKSRSFRFWLHVVGHHDPATIQLLVNVRD